MNTVRKVRTFTRAATFLDFRTYKKSRSKAKETGEQLINSVSLIIGRVKNKYLNVSQNSFYRYLFVIARLGFEVLQV